MSDIISTDTEEDLSFFDKNQLAKDIEDALVEVGLKILDQLKTEIQPLSDLVRDLSSRVKAIEDAMQSEVYS